MVAGSLWTMLVIFRLYVICFYPCNLERTDHSIIQQINLFYLLKHQHMWFIKSKKAPNLYRKKPAIEIQGRLIPVSQRWGPKLVKQNLTRTMCLFNNMLSTSNQTKLPIKCDYARWK